MGAGMRVPILLPLLLAAAACTHVGTAGDPARQATRTDLGRQLYLKYCASCHGNDARGGGPAGAKLDPKPADLTLIAKRNGGSFPYMRVYGVIDGREPFVAHSASGTAMPIWANVFTQSAAMDINDRSAVEGRIMLLTSYLESIQQK
jgi:mono/diheme cytochrome c family protein